MTAHRLFNYLSPKILPVFPAASGTLSYMQDPQHALLTRSKIAFTGTLTITATVFASGAQVTSHDREFAVRDGVVDGQPYLDSFVAPQPGYVEIDCVASQPVFHRIIPEPGYAILNRPGAGPVTVNADMKYANPRVIQQIKSHGEFCMLHAACFVDRRAGQGNSLLLINPYDRPLLARLAADNGNKATRRVAARSLEFIDLSEILDDRQWGTLMLAASNRVVTYDVRHTYGDPHAINSIDHLDPYSGYPTHRRGNLATLFKVKAKQLFRDAGITY